MIVKEDTSDPVNKKQSKKAKKAAQMDFKCPLCLENLADDINFYPCKCRYQVCRFCWHRIRTNENNLCPHCRRPYSEDPANFKPLSPEELAKLKNDKKKKEMAKKKEVAENRKQLANIRVVQKNLVFVHGLPVGIDQQEDKYQRLLQIFKEYGPVVKSVVNNKTNYAGAQIPRASIYVTYQKIGDALRAYKSLPSKIEEYEVKTSLGTTKYCSNFLKNAHCPKTDCMYLHDHAEDELCFTKEQIHAGDHLSFGNQLYDRMMSQLRSKISQTKDPVISEQEVEVQPKPHSVQVKESVNSQNSETSHSPRQNNTSPQQSRLQPLFNRDSQNHLPESDELHTQLGSRFVHKEYIGTIGSRDSHNQKLETEEMRTPFEALKFSECTDTIGNRDSQNHTREAKDFLGLSLGTNFLYKAHQIEIRTNQTNGDTSTQKSLEESTVNNTHRTVNNSETFNHPESQNTSQKDMWPDHRNSTIGQSNHVHNHQNTNYIPNDYKILNGVDSATQILSNLSVNHQENGTSHSKQIRSESLYDDLGFDPIAIAMDGMEDLLRSQEVDQKPPVTAPQSPWPQRPSVAAASSNLLLMKMNELQKRKNPPPGFAVNNLQPNQPTTTSAYDSRQNVLIDRMIPETVPNSIRNNVLIGRMSPTKLQNPIGNVLINRMSPEKVPSYSIRNNLLIDRMNPENIPNSLRNNVLVNRMNLQNVPNSIRNNVLIDRMLPENLPNSIRNNVLVDRMFPENVPNSIRNNVSISRMNPESEPNFYNPQRSNILINRMSPVNVQNSFNPARTNFPVPRYQQSGVSVNGGNSMLNGYSTPPVRNFTPQPNPQQAQAMQELLARSLSTPQHIQSQNVPHTQYSLVDPNLSSPSLWNVNQPQQWVHTENSFQAQSMQDFRPASPSMNVRRLQPQLRPIQQVPARFNNPSQYVENPQFIYQSAQHSQLSKEVVHGFP